MPRRPPLSPRQILLPAAFAALLAGCGADEAKFAPACPGLSLLKDAADLRRFTGPVGPGRPDITRMTLAARIVAVPAKCAYSDSTHTEVTATLHVQAQFLRGPAANSDAAEVRYFVALTHGDTVVREEDYQLAVKFPANVEQVFTAGDDVTLAVPVSKTETAAAYHIYVGLRLTPAELQYNRGGGL